MEDILCPKKYINVLFWMVFQQNETIYENVKSDNARMQTNGLNEHKNKQFNWWIDKAKSI